MTENDIWALFRTAEHCWKQRLFMQQTGTVISVPLNIFSGFTDTSYNLWRQQRCMWLHSCWEVASNSHLVDFPLRYLHELQQLGELEFKRYARDMMVVVFFPNTCQGPVTAKRCRTNEGPKLITLQLAMVHDLPLNYDFMHCDIFLWFNMLSVIHVSQEISLSFLFFNRKHHVSGEF